MLQTGSRSMGTFTEPASDASRKTRTKSGCLTCRGRKKKCDEVKPRCAGCRRNQLVCEWPTPGSRTTRQMDSLAPSKNDCAERQSNAVIRTTKIPPTLPSMHMDDGRACTLTSHSTTLLSHYFRETASFFAMTPLKNNPFVTVLLPIGYADDLLMHGMLALSGAHLTCKESNNETFAAATQMHYLKLISGLRTEIANLEQGDFEKTERLLRVLMVVCHYEAVSGDTQGVIFNHLRASRQLLLSLVEESPTNLTRQAIDLDALGFSLELYVYLVICNTTLAPYGLTPGRYLPLDDVLLTVLTETRVFSTFGSLFAGSQDLFRLIPEISSMATERLAEEATAIGSPESIDSSSSSSQPSAFILEKHSGLYERLTAFRIAPSTTKDSHNSHLAAAEALRAALHIYLLCALHGSHMLATSQSPTSTTLSTITSHTTTLFSHAIPLLASQQFIATLLWPIVIAGTVMRHPDGRTALIREIRNNNIGMRHLMLVGEMLELLWKEQEVDQRAYGPYGLGMVMEKYGLNIGVA